MYVAQQVGASRDEHWGKAAGTLPRLSTRRAAEVAVLLCFLIRHKNCFLNPPTKSPRPAPPEWLHSQPHPLPQGTGDSDNSSDLSSNHVTCSFNSLGFEISEFGFTLWDLFIFLIQNKFFSSLENSNMV